VSDTLETYRKSWQAKPLLQDIYDDFYERIIQACVPGRTVEIGGDDVAAPVLVEDHIGGFEPVEVIGGVLDRDLARLEQPAAIVH